MKWAFFGTDAFSVIVLEELEKAGYIPNLVITAPDRPQGRKLILTPPPAKVWAQERNIEVTQPENISTEMFSGTSWDLFIVASFGKIIPHDVITIPTHQTLNVHPSLLPKLRGASPVQTALLEENETGVSIMRIDEKMDHGPIVAQEVTHSWTEASLPDAPTLETELAHAGGKLLAQSIEPWVQGEILEQEQEHTKATYTQKLTKEDGLLHLSDDPRKNIRKIQAFKAWPKAYFFITHGEKEKRVIITDARCEDDALTILKVLPEGGKEISFEDFKKGYSFSTSE